MSKILVIQQYPHYPLPPVVESYREEGIPVERWNVCSKKTRDFASKGWLIRLWGATFLRWIPKIGKLKNKTIFATAAHLPLLAIAKLFGRMMGDYKIYLDNFYLHSLGQNKAIRFTLSWLIANPRVTIFTYSPTEVDYFKNLSALPAVTFIPFCSDFNPVIDRLPEDFHEKLSALTSKLSDNPITTSEGKPGYIFTGGYSNRDYNLIYRLAERFPSIPFVIVASSLNRLSELTKTPSNILLYTDLPNHQFESILAASTIVIIPLREDVGASGQMLAISALRNNKPTIYTDLPVISYFFKPATITNLAEQQEPHSEAGIPYTLGDLESLSTALTALTTDTAHYNSITEGQQTASSIFTLKNQLSLYKTHFHP